MFKKLFWLEYGEATFFFKKPFESIGFQIHFDGWSSPGISSASRERIISDIKSWGA